MLNRQLLEVQSNGSEEFHSETDELDDSSEGGPVLLKNEVVLVQPRKQPVLQHMKILRTVNRVSIKEKRAVNR